MLKAVKTRFRNLCIEKQSGGSFHRL